MKIPAFLKQGDTIAVHATSDGVTKELDVFRFVYGKQKLEELGYQVLLHEDLVGADEKGRSRDGKRRGETFNTLLEDSAVKWIVAAKGGNFLNEMLPYIDFEKFQQNPKWFQGYSDNTGLVHTLTTKYDIAAVYGSHFGEFGMLKWHESTENNLSILKGNSIIQHSFDAYQEEGEGWKPKNEFDLNTPTCWKSWKSEIQSVKLEGRLLGGCLDVLIFLQGTQYDHTLNFIEKYKEDGIIWYLETFDMSAESMMMFLWQLKECGWFRYTKGILFGRPLFFGSYTNTDYQEAALYALEELGVPVLFDCDFGHKGPRFTMINGVYAKVSYQNGKAELSYELTR